MINPDEKKTTKSKPIAGLKIKPKPKEPPKELYVDACKPDSCTGLINTQSSSDPSAQYQRQKIIQNTVKVSSSLYAMNKASLIVYQSQYSDSANTVLDASSNAISNWNQMSDRKEAHVQKQAMSMKSSVSLRPGNMTPGGIGCDIKHNSYDRYLARLKGSAPLRKEGLPANYGEIVPFNPANPVYGGKTVKTSIGTSDCTICVIPPTSPPIPTTGVFIYSFRFTGTIPGDKTPAEYFLEYMPIINTGNSFEYTYAVSIESNVVTSTVSYGFVNSGNNDGLIFTQTVADFYNTYTTGLRIVTFGKIPLSPGGSQFTKLNKLPVFPIEPLLLEITEYDVPEILVGSSLAYCFAGITDGFGTNRDISDYILTNWQLTNTVNTSYMFYNSWVNPSQFILDITYIDDLTSMFEGAIFFNPETTIITIQNTNNLRAQTPYLFKVHTPAKLTIKPAPKPVKKMASLFAKAVAMVGKPTFKFFNAAVLPQAYKKPLKITNLQASSLTNMKNMFYGCRFFNPDPENFQFLALPTDTSGMFYGCSSFNLPLNSTANPQTNLVTDNVTDMSYMFFNSTEFNQPIVSTGFNVSAVTRMDYMFSGATSFNQDLTNLNISPNLLSSVNIFSNSGIDQTNIPSYFLFKYSFVYLGGPITDFEPYLPVTNNDGSFALSTTQVPLASDLTSPITRPTLITISCSYKFSDNGTTNDGLTFNSDFLKSFYNTHTTNLTIVQFSGMNLSRAGYQFTGLNSFKIADIEAPSIVPNTLLTNCFSGMSTFNDNIRVWNTRGVVNMNGMFQNASSFNQNIRGWDVQNVITHIDFSTGSPLTAANTPRFIPPPTGFIYSFTYQGSETDLTPYIPMLNANSSFRFTSPVVISKSISNVVKIIVNFEYSDGGFNDGLTFNFNQLTDFYNGPLISGLTINQFDNIPLSRGSQQFFNLTTLLKIVALDSPTILSNTSLKLCCSSVLGNSQFNSDISNWNTTNVIDMSFMFWYATMFNQDISSLDTTNVTDMTSMFQGAVSFNQNISGWVTTNTSAYANFYLNSGLSIANVPPKFV